jgi:hypothetical protein
LCNFSIFRARAALWAPTSQIVEDQEFGSAFVKIQRWQTGGEVFALTKKEKRSVCHLQQIAIHSDNGPDEPNANIVASSELQAAFQTIKKRKLVKFHEAEKFIDLRFIRPTNNVCERQCSVSGFANTKNCQGLLPVNLEMQLFFKANSHLWDVAVFHHEI